MHYRLFLLFESRVQTSPFSFVYVICLMVVLVTFSPLVISKVTVISNYSLIILVKIWLFKMLHLLSLYKQLSALDGFE